jgi:hypothetical protein
MPDQVLVERLRAGHSTPSEGCLRRPARPMRCQVGGDRDRIAVEHDHVERADVDAESSALVLTMPSTAALAHGLLHRAPFGRQVAASGRRGCAAACAGSWSNTSFRYFVSTRPCVRDCANTSVFRPALIARPRDAVALRARAGAQAEVGIDHRRVPQQHVLVAGRRAAFGDRVHLVLDQRLGVRLRVADGRRAQDELRVGPVERADALEPAQHVGHVRAEHAAVGVDLVDDDVLQVLEELRPLGVVRQDRLVQHVGLLTTMSPCRRIAWRASPGVSPSKVNARNPRSRRG